MARRRYAEEKIKAVEDATGRPLPPEAELHHTQEAKARVGDVTRFLEMARTTPKSTQSKPMTPKHPLFWEFCDLLEEYLRHRPCIGDHNNKEGAIAVLKILGFTRKVIKKSLRKLEKAGGGCDCEILMNTARKAQYQQNEPEPEREGAQRSEDALGKRCADEETLPDRFQLTPEEMDALNLEPSREYLGVYLDKANGLWATILRIDGAGDIPPEELEALREMPREELDHSAIDGLGYLMHKADENGEPAGLSLFLTKRAAEEIWPTN
jgi:hypothetical protein